jgi:pantoate--beta-alanine ligase
MKIIRTVKEMHRISDALRREGRRIALVPTMGCLHAGHLALVREAKEQADVVVVSIFVNPTQFGPKEDFGRYPRDFERDRAALEKESTDIIFSPGVPEMYPKGYSTYVEVRGLTDHLCGLQRESHFLGVATVVMKLFNAVKPHVAIFGQKDYQQLKVIERMVRDLDMDVEVIGLATVREADGLAMSSRNAYLSEEERTKALLINRAIRRAKEAFRGGERKASRLSEEVRKILGSNDGISIEYVTVCDAETLVDLEKVDRRALIAVAASVGKTRLIDNTILAERPDAEEHSRAENRANHWYGRQSRL